MIDKEIYNDIISGTNIVSGKEYRDIMCTISQLASDMVVQTLGPYGATTMLDTGTGFTYPTKDGWSALNKLKFNDPIYNTAFNLLKQISFNSVNSVGDGTTTAMVAANAFLQNIISLKLDERSDFDQASFRADVEKVKNNIIDTLTNRYSKRVEPGEKGIETIRQIAYIATNGNDKVADMIANIFRETSNLNIHVQMDDSDEIKYDIESGYKLDAKMLNFYAYVNSDGKRYIDHNDRILIIDHSVTYVDHKFLISSLSQYAEKINGTILIFAPYFDDTISRQIGLAVQNMANAKMVPNIALVQVPVTTSLQKKSLKDLSVLTAASIFDTTKVKIFNTMVYNATHEEKMDESIYDLDPEKYDYPEEVISKSLGTAKTIEFSETEGFIRDYEDIVSSTQYNGILDEAKNEYETAREKANRVMNGTMDKDYLDAHMRYIKLLGKTGVIKVGGASEIEKKCDKDSIDDAVLACRSAWTHGYIRGMCLDTLKAITNYNNLYPDHTGEYKEIALKALEVAFSTVAMAVLNNKCAPTVKQSTWYEHAESYQTNVDILASCVDEDLCYDIRTNTFYDETEYPIINSLATDVQVLRATVGVLTMVITSNQFLSMTKQYDRKISRENALKQMATQKKVEGAAFATGVLRTLRENDVLDKIEEMLTNAVENALVSMSMQMMSDDDLPFTMADENGEDVPPADPFKDFENSATGTPPDEFPYQTTSGSMEQYPTNYPYTGYSNDIHG